jgi:hypothetical protein
MEKQKMTIEDKLKTISEVLGAGGCFVVFYVPTVETYGGAEKTAETPKESQSAGNPPRTTGAKMVTTSQINAIEKLCESKGADCDEQVKLASGGRTYKLNGLTFDEAAECIKTLSAL